MKQLVGGHVRKDEAQGLRRVEIIGHLDRVLLQHTDSLGVCAPDRQRADTVADAQCRAARTELLDDADQLVAGGERRLRHAEVRTGAEHGIGVRHTGRQNPHTHLTRTRPGNLIIDHPHDLGAAEVIHDHALHPVTVAGLHRDLLPSVLVVRFATKLAAVRSPRHPPGVLIARQGFGEGGRGRMPAASRCASRDHGARWHSPRRHPRRWPSVRYSPAQGAARVVTVIADTPGAGRRCQAARPAAADARRRPVLSSMRTRAKRPIFHTTHATAAEESRESRDLGGRAAGRRTVEHVVLYEQRRGDRQRDDREARRRSEPVAAV
jgi:hypothetical protein